MAYFINEIGGEQEHFIKLASDNEKSNPLSLIFCFLELKKHEQSTCKRKE